MDLKRAIAAVTIEPAQILDLDVGAIGVGDIADICIFDPNKNWLMTEATMRSQGKNTPFLDRTFRGKVCTTLVNGRIVHEAKA
jgi:dihydroorotase